MATWRDNLDRTCKTCAWVSCANRLARDPGGWDGRTRALSATPCPGWANKAATEAWIEEATRAAEDERDSLVVLAWLEQRLNTAAGFVSQ